MTFTYPTQYKLAGTGSYRLASTKLLDSYGGNLQNSDHDMLEVFAVRQPWEIGQSDQSGAEALVVAYLAEPGRYRELFTHGHKPHTYLAFRLFGKQSSWPLERSYEWYCDCPIAELETAPGWKAVAKAIKYSDREYDVGKRTCHGKSYKMGIKTFIVTALKNSEGRLVMSYSEAKHYLDTFERLFPEVIDWQNEIEFRAKKYRELVNLLGYPKQFHRNFTDSYVREIISWIPQSTVGCITHQAVLYTASEARKRDIPLRVISNKHDSLACLYPNKHRDFAKETMSIGLARKMTGRNGVEFVMKSEFVCGQNWAKFDPKNPLDNPNGLKEVK